MRSSMETMPTHTLTGSRVGSELSTWSTAAR